MTTEEAVSIRYRRKIPGNTALRQPRAQRCWTAAQSSGAGPAAASPHSCEGEPSIGRPLARPCEPTAPIKSKVPSPGSGASGVTPVNPGGQAGQYRRPRGRHRPGLPWQARITGQSGPPGQH